jgi:catechol 2,3-dioxygenase-like lactoylglutathione lyase family enzyme
MSTWPGGISAITLFVVDLEAAKEFYDRAFGLPTYSQDANSAVYNFGNTLINLLRVEEAPSPIAPAKVAAPDAGARVQFTIDVDDVDAMCADLEKRGVVLLNGPGAQARLCQAGTPSDVRALRGTEWRKSPKAMAV